MCANVYVPIVLWYMYRVPMVLSTCYCLTANYHGSLTADGSAVGGTAQLPAASQQHQLCYAAARPSRRRSLQRGLHYGALLPHCRNTGRWYMTLALRPLYQWYHDCCNMCPAPWYRGICGLAVGCVADAQLPSTSFGKSVCSRSCLSVALLRFTQPDQATRLRCWCRCPLAS